MRLNIYQNPSNSNLFNHFKSIQKKLSCSYCYSCRLSCSLFFLVFLFIIFIRSGFILILKSPIKVLFIISCISFFVFGFYHSLRLFSFILSRRQIFLLCRWDIFLLLRAYISLLCWRVVFIVLRRRCIFIVLRKRCVFVVLRKRIVFLLLRRRHVFLILR